VFTFALGFGAGWVFFRFRAPLVALVKRTEEKVEKSLNETMKK